MNKLKSCLIGALALIGFSAPAVAGPIVVSVSNVQVNWGQGQGLTIKAGANSMGLYYAGPIFFTINGTNGPIVVWCDDLYNDVYIGSSDTYYKVSPTAYLSPLSPATIHTIAGLAYEGTLESLANTLTPARGAEFQLAIWEQEYGNILDVADPGIQTGINTLIGLAPAFFANMKAGGWAYDELDSPGCGQQADAITFQNGCQTQGQIYVHPIDRVPEPATIAILLSGMLGLAWLRPRRKAAAQETL